MNSAGTNATRLYPFADQDGHYFYAGTIDGGRQLLLFEGGLALFFDADGNLLGHERREPPPEQPLPRDESGEGGLKLDTRKNVLGQVFAHWKTDEGRRDLEHMDREEERIRAIFYRPWLRELGFRPGTIRVKKLADPETGVSIDDHPKYLANFLDGTPDPCFSAEDLEGFSAEIDHWRNRGLFVLNNRYDIWIDGEGNIDST
ncbi:MAG TPA: hypothetical protein VG406_03610 [Isosphaeraceae bacterium]|jgi:hypothetical protein|nr:hypothetical protein [Isosphaeraceae bacterium]